MLYRTVQYLTTGELPPEPSAREKIEIAILHLDRLVDLKSERIAVREMRKHIAWYLKGLRGSKPVKDKVMEESTRDGLVRILMDYVEQLEQGEATAAV